MADRKEVEKFNLPEGRLINQSLFVLDQFDPSSKPKYNVELAFKPEDLDSIEDKLAAAAEEFWGAGAKEDYWDGKIRSPILPGDEMAARRDAEGKPGDAYKGKLVIRAHTQFNKHGAEGPGGIQVFGPNIQPIEAVESGEIYLGLYGVARVSIGKYKENATGRDALMFYLCAFQKTRDGEPLVSAADHSQAFKPVGRDQDGGTGGRRRRAG